ncbi:MAG: hypothetical protein ABFS09_03405 [Thermodesulfobacteriota bacterium]
MTDLKKKNTLIYNILFIVVGGGLLLFLLRAPEESTARIPYDDDHSRFYSMGKKEAEKFCESCHFPEGDMPLPENHPPKYRCLFCHKKVETNGR